MIHVPTAPWAHPIFDVIAYPSGLATSVVLYRWRLRVAATRLANTVAWGYFAALCVGAVVGAWVSGSLNTLQNPVPTLSHSIAGALVGAIVGVEIYKYVQGIRTSTGALFVGSFCVGVIIGRWGCLFTGLPDQTCGTLTKLPWGVDLGDGLSRHPVQIYESLSMAAFLVVYLVALQRRAAWPIERGFYVMCFVYGFQRFLWEFLKPYPQIGPLNIFQVLCIALMIYAVVYAWRGPAYAGDQEIGALYLSRADDQSMRNLSCPGADKDHG